MANKLFSKDLYAILGVKEEATEKEILKGYRKRALKCHPDKNPDNPKAAEEFHQLSEALEILTDAAARAAYDQARKAKKAVLERNKVLDSKRKKFKEDLEAREQAFFEQSQKQKEVLTEEKLAAEIARLKKEGSRLLEQEQELLLEELKKAASEAKHASHLDEDESSTESSKVKLKWKAAKGDPQNGGYTSDYLRNLLGCYGSVAALVMSSKKNGSAIVEFEGTGVSSDILQENGRAENPFTMTWLSGKPDENTASSSTHTANGGGIFNTNANVFPAGYSATDYQSTGSAMGGARVNDEPSAGDKDFESVVLMKMRQAEERKRLIEQMMKEDEEG